MAFRNRLLDQAEAASPLLSAAAILLLVLATFGSGIWAPLNGLFYDAAIEVLVQPAQDDVVVVEVPSSLDTSSVRWPDLAEELLAASSRAVAFTFATSQSFSSINPSAPVFLPFSPEATVNPAMSPPVQPRRGAIVIPPAQYGIHRTQLTFVAGSTGSIPTLEATVAGTTDDRPFYVRFPGGLEGIPRIAADDLLQGRVPEELLADRVVLIGQVSAEAPGLTTSINLNLPVMDPLIYHAFALQTLMSGNVPRALSLLPAAFLIGFSLVFGAAAYHRTTPRQALGVAVVVPLVIVTSGLLALLWLDIVIPAAELLVSHVLLSLLIWSRREKVQDRALQQMARSVPSKVSDRFYSEPGEQWPAEILELDKSVVISLDERRRFTPASRAQLQKLAMPENVLSGADPAFEKAARTLAPAMVKTARPSWWVAPLLRDGLLAGYWLFQQQDPEISASPSSARAVDAFSAAIADLALPRQSEGWRPVKERIFQDLSSALSNQQSRISALEQLLDEASAGLSVRDLLGNEILSTEGFRKQIEAVRLASGSRTGPLELVGALTGLDRKRSAAALRFAVAERGRISLPMTASGQRHAVLNLSRLKPQDAQGSGYLLFQIVDFSQAVQTAEVQRTASEQLGYMVRNDLEAVGLASALLEHPDLGPQDRSEVLARMREAIDRARQRLASIEPFLQSQPLMGGDDMLLLDVQDVLREVVAALRQDVEVELHMPDFMAAVMAEPETLRTLLRSALEFLADDAGPEAPVTVSVSEEIDKARITMTTPSTGLTQERLEEFLSGAREPASASMRTMVNAAGKVSIWGGVFEAHSDAHTNVRFVLTLRKLV